MLTNKIKYIHYQLKEIERKLKTIKNIQSKKVLLKEKIKFLKELKAQGEQYYKGKPIIV